MQASDVPDGRPPGADGRRRILEAAVRLLETHGEASLRMTAIAEEAGVAVALITHHFGSRDGLVAAAQQARVAGAVSADLAAFEAILSDVETAETLLERLDAVVASVVDESRAPTRLSRIAALAGAHGRPDAKAMLGETIGELLSKLAALIEEGQQRGLIRADVDARALGTFIQAYALGLVLADLDPDRADPDELRRVIALTYGTFATGREQ
jgi:AcrR family transcriptional regulator